MDCRTWNQLLHIHTYKTKQKQDAPPTPITRSIAHSSILHHTEEEEEGDGKEDAGDEEYEWGGRFSIAWDRAPLMADFPAALAERAFFLGR